MIYAAAKVISEPIIDCLQTIWEACGAVGCALVFGSGGSNPTAVSMSLCP